MTASGGSSWPEWLAARAAERAGAGLQRSLRPRAADDDLLDLAGNDYLGLGRHPEVVAAAAAAARTWGAGAGASRLVTGTLALHDELETALADLTGRPAALVTSTGYQANLAVVTALAGRDTLVVSDAHVHASLVDAARLSRAEVAVVPHGDVGAVSAALAGADGRRAMVLTESVFSVLGDAAPLLELAGVCASYGALLVVDEAHGLGVAGVGGRGLVHQQGLARQEHVVVTATLSKALGAQGGAVLGSPAVVEHLVNRARPFIFDTGLAPAAAGGALAAIGVLRRDAGLPALVHDRIAALAGALGVEAPAGAVLSVPMPSPQAALAAQAAAREEGVLVGCFRPPSVPDGVSRLRVTATAGLGDADWARAAGVVGQVAKELGAKELGAGEQGAG
jgi:8-amino-7-oxononanoate synthase